MSKEAPELWHASSRGLRWARSALLVVCVALLLRYASRNSDDFTRVFLGPLTKVHGRMVEVGFWHQEQTTVMDMRVALSDAVAVCEAARPRLIKLRSRFDGKAFERTCKKTLDVRINLEGTFTRKLAAFEKMRAKTPMSTFIWFDEPREPIEDLQTVVRQEAVSAVLAARRVLKGR